MKNVSGSQDTPITSGEAMSDGLRERAWKLECDLRSMGENDRREIIEHALRAAVEAERAETVRVHHEKMRYFDMLLELSSRTDLPDFVRAIIEPALYKDKTVS